jgi:hypothetical protein
MSPLKRFLIDGTLILAGVAVSTLFVSIDGNGQAPMPVAAGMLMVAAITGGRAAARQHDHFTAPSASAVATFAAQFSTAVAVSCRSLR